MTFRDSNGDDIITQSSLPSIDEGYETMVSGSSDQSSSDDDGEPQNHEVDLNAHRQANELLKQYSIHSSGTEEQMKASNEYVRGIRSTREWDSIIEFDGPGDSDDTSMQGYIPSEIYEGMCFATKQELQFAINGWSIINNVEFKQFSSNQTKYTIICVHNEDEMRSCKWRMHASCRKRLGGAWVISKLNGPHTCMHPIMNSGHRQCNSKFICYFIQSCIRQQIDLKPREIIGRVEAKFNIRVSYMKAWDARRKAIKAVFGSWEESYTTLHLFLEAISKVMPGTVYRTRISSTRRFERLFWSFAPSLQGWQHCRPVLCLDGTFLLGKYRGTLLTAIAIDANNGLFPLAFAVVEGENIESWVWFLTCISELIPMVNARRDLCLISDRHAGLVRGCRDIFPWAAHRHCLRHLRENFKKAIRTMGISDVDFLCQKMYIAGNTSDIRIFNRMMSDIKNVKEEAHKWLIDRDPSKWSLTHDGGYRYGTMTTNAAECFNGVLKRARGLPIQALITSIYYNIVAMFMKRFMTAQTLQSSNESPFVPRIKKLLLGYEDEVRRMPEPIRINTHEVQVFDVGAHSYKVDIASMDTYACSCLRPQIFHMPCPHVIAALGQRHLNHQSYISYYYTLDAYKDSYSHEFHVIPDRSAWSQFDPCNGIIELQPPIYRAKKGRPRTKRYTNTMDESSSRSGRLCGICKQSGHNRARCPTKALNMNHVSL